MVFMLLIGRTDNKYITVNFAFFCLLIVSSAFGESLSDLLSFQLDINYVFLIVLFCMMGLFTVYIRSRQDNLILFWCMVIVLCLLGTSFVDLLALDLNVPLSVVSFIILLLFISVYVFLFLAKKKFLQFERETRLNFLFWFEVFVLIALGTALGDLNRADPAVIQLNQYRQHAVFLYIQKFCVTVLPAERAGFLLTHGVLRQSPVIFQNLRLIVLK